MYSIRLELGREEEDLRFMRYMEQLRAQEREAMARGENSSKKSEWNFRKMLWFLRLSLQFLFLLLIIVFIVFDTLKVKELNNIRYEIEHAPKYMAAAPSIDSTVVEEIEEQERIEEEKKNQQYSAEMTDDTKPIADDVVSAYGIVVDTNTNTILQQRSSRERISPASMTKILTVLVAAENIDESKLQDTFTITPEITYYSYKNDCSAVGFSDNETVTVEDLFYGTILPSGADAAVGLAEYVAGSQEEFVKLMNEKLETLGVSESAHFTNCVGLYDEDHYCTVYDMAMIIHAAIDNEFVRKVMSTHVYTTSKTEQHPDGIEISNWFLRRIEDKPVGGEVLCAKTGYVSQIGNCAASYGTDGNGNDFVVVTASSTSSWRCIYDHVALYRSVFPGYNSENVDVKEEAEEMLEEDTEEQANGGNT